MRNLKSQTLFLALFLGLSAFGCGRDAGEGEEDRIAAQQDEIVSEDPEIQPEQRVVVVEPETGEDPGVQSDLEEREQRLAERRAELDAREERLRGEELTQREERLRQPEPERQARAPRPQPQPQPQPRVERPVEPEPVETEETEEIAEEPRRSTNEDEEDREAAELAEERRAREREERAENEAGDEREAREEEEQRTEREAPAPLVVEVPAGTVMEVELLEGLSSQTSEPGEIFRARIASNVGSDGSVGIPAGSEVVGVVTEAVPLGKVGGRAKLALKFTDLILPSGKTVPIQASLVQQGRNETGKDAATIGGAAAGGAILGRVLNKKDRSKGAVIGAVIGAAAGAVLASRTPGEEVVIPEGTRLDLKLDDGIEVRPRR
ncbi:MAG TPA: hypothetical protein VN493_17505 [Thermoanaerobaculia bacterium]|nr:hypothetical protein [Thermoanaerobaculia bacterium]